VNETFDNSITIDDVRGFERPIGGSSSGKDYFNTTLLNSK